MLHAYSYSNNFKIMTTYKPSEYNKGLRAMWREHRINTHLKLHLNLAVILSLNQLSTYCRDKLIENAEIMDINYVFPPNMSE